MDDIFLLGFLRGMEFNVESSLQLLRNYYSTRLEYPAYFKNLFPSKLEKALSSNCMRFLPQPDQNGRYICIGQLGHWDPSEVLLIDVYRLTFLLADLFFTLHQCQENGIVLILDCKNSTFKQLMEYTPRFIHNLVSLISNDSNQVFIKEMHFVNLNVIVKGLVKFSLSLFPAKLRNKIFPHSDMTSLHEFVHPEYLPIEYGGELPYFDSSELFVVVRQNEEFYVRNEKFLKMYNETVQ
ncbi:alpha-tocopherol transfer protein-like [Centruroides sculpturatus]|uniref:alpha-tocopherol transfer protein-like n=1 Tax=Centruroides sculpturatus TaxID=218467 RepID=UPI000C6D3222|nr:alpha-tocopherol transfer protein-like [Centruroides sculpturatus]